MRTVMLANNPMDSNSWRRYDVKHVGKFLRKHFKQGWPETAHIYAGSVAKENDVTPNDEESIQRLETFDEPLWVVVYPATGVEVALAIGVILTAASVAAILLIPDAKVKTPKDRVSLSGSPNNSLTDRSNTARPEQRIPDIFGLVRSRPDMIMVPYTQYENHRQVEIGYYCIGRGFFDVQDARDGPTHIRDIQGASCHVYNPGDAPTGPGPHTGTAQAFGDPINDPVLNVFPIKAVNGQSITPWNARTLYGCAKKTDKDKKKTENVNTNSVYNFFNIMSIEYVDASHGIIHAPYLKEVQYVHDRVEVGDRLFMFMDSTKLFGGSSPPRPNLQSDLDEPFANSPIVNSLTDNGDYVDIGIDIPLALQAEWALIPAYCAAHSADVTHFNRFGTSFDVMWAEITSLEHLFEGPFFVDVTHPVGSSNPAVMVNFVAPSGLFMEDGTTIQKQEYECGLEVTPCNSSGVATGSPIYYQQTLVGSDLSSDIRALSFYQILPFNGRFLLRTRIVNRRVRTAELPDFVAIDNYGTDPTTGKAYQAYTGRIQDEIRTTEAYAFSEPPNISFGNVTTVHTRTINTPGATKVKERELNLLVKRKIPIWNGTIMTGLFADDTAENVLFSVMLDQNIGNRPTSQIDFQNIADCMAAVRDYFRTSEADLPTRVAITLDDAQTSFEETVATIADMAFARVYRQGNLLRAKPELATDDCVVAFNHRNILPGSQRISHTMGPPTENDSIEVTYTDINDSSVTTVRVPFFVSTFQPKELRVAGLGTRKQAIYHAYRAYNKMLFQRQALEMQTTQEAGYALIADRILAADVTIADTQSGHVVQVSGLNIKSSQAPFFQIGHTYHAFLNLRDGSVEAIPVTAGSGVFDFVLGSAPSLSLVTDPETGVPTTYTIVSDDEASAFAYLISELSAENNMVWNVNAINYSNMYYMADSMDIWVLGDGLLDRSPEERALTSDHSLSNTTGPDGSQMLSCDGTNEMTTVDGLDRSDNTHGYSCFAKVVHNSTPSFGYSGLIQTTDDQAQLFGFFDNSIAAGHNNTLPLQVAAPTGTLMTAGVTYDPGTQRLALFLNGALVGQTTIATPTTSNQSHSYLKQFNGLAGNVIRYRRTLSDRAMMELHLKTKL